MYIIYIHYIYIYIIYIYTLYIYIHYIYIHDFVGSAHTYIYIYTYTRLGSVHPRKEINYSSCFNSEIIIIR